MKKGVLFVGSFVTEGKHGHLGGQMYACTSLLSSNIKNDYNWFLIDSTAPSVITGSFFSRLYNAAIRILKFISLLIFKFKQIHTVLIFCGDGFSIIEKGTMIYIAKIFNKRAILAPRSGLIISDFKKPKLLKFIRSVFEKADYVICQGEYWKAIFLEQLQSNPSKLIVINNWLDYTLYNMSSDADKNKKVIISYIGWIEKFKGIDDILAVIEKVNSKYQERVEFRIGGSGSEFDRVSELISKKWDNVYLLGWVKGDEKRKLLSDTDIYIQMSHFEGFPNSLLEAMASSKAVISTRVGSVPDLIGDTFNGFMCEVGDVKKAAEFIELLILNPSKRQAVAQSARDTVAKNFSVDQAVIKLQAIL